MISIFRVPFQQALPLIASRAVYMEAGYAYVPFHKFVSIITTRVSSRPFLFCPKILLVCIYWFDTILYD